MGDRIFYSCFGTLLALFFNSTLLKNSVAIPPGPGLTNIGLIALKIQLLPMHNAFIFPTLQQWAQVYGLIGI